VTDRPDDLGELRTALEQTAEIADPTEQMLEIAAVVAAALAPIGVRPVVVGGLAVAYWTAGTYLTGDIDVVMPHLPDISDRLAALGFEREGRHWALPGRKQALEAPASRLEFDPDGFSEVQLGSGRAVLVQDVEEVLLVRLDEFVATGHADVFQQCLWLRASAMLDRDRLRRGAAAQSLGRALDALERTARDLERGAPPQDIPDLHDLAMSLRLPPRGLER
jgi:hypothetical protein